MILRIIKNKKVIKLCNFNICCNSGKNISYIIQIEYLEFVATKLKICSTFLLGLYRLKIKIYTVYIIIWNTKFIQHLE